MSRRTTPCKIVVLPVLSDRMITNNESRKSTVDPALIPRESGRPVYRETKETVGIVRPIVANAEPKERLRLFCN